GNGSFLVNPHGEVLLGRRGRSLLGALALDTGRGVHGVLLRDGLVRVTRGWAAWVGGRGRSARGSVRVAGRGGTRAAARGRGWRPDGAHTPDPDPTATGGTGGGHTPCSGTSGGVRRVFGAEVAAVAGTAPAAALLQQPAKLTVRVRLMPDRPMPLDVTTGAVTPDRQVGVGGHA